jgi:AcrR family transcriptional regulator
MRADARRNYQRLLDEARAAFLTHGVDAPLEEIARSAGVGIGTLYRHFPTRMALQEAVYGGQVRALCAEAYRLAEDLPSGDALAAWLRSFARCATGARGLVQTLKAVIGKDAELLARCHGEILTAAERVLAQAQEAGTARRDVTAADLLRLVHGLCVAAEHAPGETDRLFSFLLDGLRPQS